MANYSTCVKIKCKPQETRIMVSFFGKVCSHKHTQKNEIGREIAVCRAVKYKVFKRTNWLGIILELAFNSSKKNGIDMSCQRMCSSKDERKERERTTTLGQPTNYYWYFLWALRSRKCPVQDLRWRLLAATVSGSDKSYPSSLTRHTRQKPLLLDASEPPGFPQMKNINSPIN